MSSFNFNSGIEEKYQLEILMIIRNVAKNKTQFSVYIFGSRARGDYKKFSDVDILIKSAPPLLAIERAQMRSEFEDSDIPYKIDFMEIEDVAESYLSQIELEKIQIF